MTRARALLPALVLTVGLGASCDRVDPTTVLKPTEVITGWYDVGIEDGKNKLVPSISLRLMNQSDDEIESVQINAIFKRQGEAEMWGEHYGWAVQREPLSPQGSTQPLVLRSGLGYTGEQPRAQMLRNREFVDAKVEIFLKQGSRVWAKLAEFPIERQLLTQ